ncbi:MAG: IPT/TIG domain-containing protein, partial [Bryobacteraceae bacterium]
QSTFGAFGPRHVVFTLPNDVYVLPSGMNLVQSRPPSISTAAPGFDANGQRIATISGAALTSDTRFFFDGVPGVLQRLDEAGRAVVTVPPGQAGRLAVLTAFNTDGQNSMFVQSAAPPTYLYDSGDAGLVTLSPAGLPSGTEALVEVNGINTNFVEGLTTLGFGSSDIQVRRMFVVSPARILANVWIAPNASLGSVNVSVFTGYQIVSQPLSFQIQPANPRIPAVTSIINPTGAQTGIYAGATLTLFGSNLAGASVTIGDRPAAVLSATANQITFQVPAGLPAGPVVMRVTNGGDSISLVLSLDGLPPEIRSLALAIGCAIDPGRPAHGGDVLVLTVGGLGDPGSSVASSRIRVSVGGLDQQVAAVYPVTNGHQIQFVLAPTTTQGTQIPLTVSVDGRASLPYMIPVR